MKQHIQNKISDKQKPTSFLAYLPEKLADIFNVYDSSETIFQDQSSICLRYSLQE